MEGKLINLRISETDRKILEVIKEKENPGYRSIAASLQRNPAVIRRHVRNCLFERGLVESLEGGGWRITSLGLQALQRRERFRDQSKRRRPAKGSRSSSSRRGVRSSPNKDRDGMRRRPFRNASRRRQVSRTRGKHSGTKSSRRYE